MSTPETQPQLLTVREVGAMLNLGRATVYRRIYDGTIPAVRVGGTLRVDREELAAYVYGEPEAER